MVKIAFLVNFIQQEVPLVTVLFGLHKGEPDFFFFFGRSFFLTFFSHHRFFQKCKHDFTS
jgi:hypothetical protein